MSKVPSNMQPKKSKQKRDNNVIKEESTEYLVQMPKGRRSSSVTTARKYVVRFVSEAKRIASGWLKTVNLDKAVSFGLPEVDDRYHVWRVPLVMPKTNKRIGEVVIDAYTSLIIADETTTPRGFNDICVGVICIEPK